MDRKKPLQFKNFISISLFLVLLGPLQPAPIKIKVIVDGVSVKVTPEIGGKNLARVPLDTILVSEGKQGEWYKVTMEKEGVQISGFIHEMLVEEVMEEQMEALEKGVRKAARSQAEIMAEIELRMEESKKLVRQETDFEEAIDSLKSLIAKAFNVQDTRRQKGLAAEIFLWIGLAYAGMGDDRSALKQFHYMFEVDHTFAKEVTRNIFNPKIVGLIQQAEMQYLGLVTEYTLNISTQPEGAMIKIDGKEVAFSPGMHKTLSPNVVIEIEKEGYKPVREELFLTQPETQKIYHLERAGINIEIRSLPPGAAVFLDGQDTGKVTDCILLFVPFGDHKLSVAKENFTSWEDEIEVRDTSEQPVIEIVLTPTKYEFVKKWGDPQKTFFEHPAGITLDREDNFYIIDLSEIKVKKFDREGKILTVWASGRNDFKEIRTPGGIAVDHEGYLYVTDADKHTLSKFDRMGRLIRKWGKEGTADDELKIPLGIVVDHNNDVYVADSGNHCIKKFSHLGVFKKKWGKQGVSQGEFVFPGAIALNQKNEVLVADRFRVQKFTSEGDFIHSWGKAGMAEGEFDRPMGIWVDPNNYVYVADAGNNRIQKFDNEGKFITQWGSKGSSEGKMNYPNGIVVNSQDHVFIVERDNNRLQIFKPPSESDSKSNNTGLYLPLHPFMLLSSIR